MLYHWSTAGFLSTVLLMWVSAGFQVKLTRSAVLYFSFFAERGGQPVTLEPSATPAFLLLKVTVVPSGRAGEWQASLDLGRRMHASLPGNGRGGAVSTPASDQLLLPGHFAVYRTGLEHRKIFLMWLMQSKVGCSGITGICIFFK